MHNKTLRNQGTKKDIPTGETPRKRTWSYVDQWELTKSREEIIETYRESGRQAEWSQTNHERSDCIEDAPQSAVEMEAEDFAAQNDENLSLEVIPSKLKDNFYLNKNDKILPPRTLAERSANVPSNSQRYKFTR